VENHGKTNGLAKKWWPEKRKKQQNFWGKKKLSGDIRKWWMH
jgi:hypothetical protein